MSQDSQDFGSLRRLLAIKRHEQPPPGYFNGFSRQVIARIKAGERGAEGGLDLFWDAPWLQRLWTALETKPVMAGAFGAAFCALLIGGVIYSEKSDVQPGIAGSVPAESLPMQIANASASDQLMQAMPAAIGFPGRSPVSESIAPAAASSGLFDLVPRPKAEPASATLILGLPGGN
jgi:hypothetical protein